MYRVRYFATLLHLVTEYRRRDKYEEEDEEFKIKFPGIIEKRKLCLLGLRCNCGRGYQGNVKITKNFLASHRYIIVNVISIFLLGSSDKYSFFASRYFCEIFLQLQIESVS